MFETKFRSEVLPAGESLNALNQLYIGSGLPIRMVSETPRDFTATLRTLDLGQVKVSDLSSSSSDMVRTSKLVRQADPELCGIAMPLSGKIVVSQAGREAVLRTPDLALFDSSSPLRIRIAPDGGHSRLLRAHIPRALLGLPPAGVTRLLARPLSGKRGFAGALTQFLTGAATGSGGYRPDDLPRLGMLVHDLLAAIIAHHLDADLTVPDESRRPRLLLSVDKFVQQHLGDAYLTPGTIAAAHHISVGHLHRLFLTRDVTVAAWIRQQRLEHARRDLADPGLRTVLVHQIAARWGFKDHPNFTRAFRTAYGTSPTDYRHHAADPSRGSTRAEGADGTRDVKRSWTASGPG